MEFYERLIERADVTEKVFVETDVVAPDIYQQLKERFLNNLPEEKEDIYRLRDDTQQIVRNKLGQLYPEEFVEDIFNAESTAKFENGHIQGVGKRYSIARGEFLVIVTAVDEMGRDKLKALKYILLTSFPLSIFVIIIIGRFDANRAFAPVSKITDKVNSIGASSLHLRLEVGNKHDEIGQLAQTFNKLLDRLEASFEMQKNFISNASHELRNPLAAIMGESEVCLTKKRTPEEYIKAVRIINGEADRLNTIVNNLLTLATSNVESIKKEEFRIDELLMDAVALIKRSHPQQEIEIDYLSLPEDVSKIEMMGNYSLLYMVLINIIENALKFSEHKPLKIWFEYPGNNLALKIQDQGIGIPEEDIKHIYEPFYRSKNARGFKGFGIGLSLAIKIMKLHKGELLIDSTVGKGTTITLLFTYNNDPFQVDDFILPQLSVQD